MYWNIWEKVSVLQRLERLWLDFIIQPWSSQQDMILSGLLPTSNMSLATAYNNPHVHDRHLPELRVLENEYDLLRFQ